MQKVRRTRRENVTKREANISILASQEKSWIFRNSPQKGERHEIDFFRAKRAIPTDTMSLYFGFQKSDKINSCGFNPIQFVVDVYGR